MDELSNEAEAVELLQQLGLKEYEAKCFVALSRLPSGTAKEISEHSEVPRTRVYDATRVLESKGLVEVQHSSPQRFRAVSIREATSTLRQEYEDRTARLQESLDQVEPLEGGEDDAEVTHEVWALSGSGAIHNRTVELVDEADQEVVLVLGGSATLTDDLFERLSAAQDRGATLLIGTVDEGLREEILDRLPEAQVFVSGLEWLEGVAPEDDTDISRLLMVDRGTILVSTIHSDDATEQAVFGRGFDNGLVTMARRLMATGLLPSEDPGTGETR